MTLDNLSCGWDVGYTGVSGSEFPTGGTGSQQRSRQCLKVSLSDLISICQGKVLKVSFCHYFIWIGRILNTMMGYYTCVKRKNNGTRTWPKNLIHHVLIYWTKVWWSGSTNVRLDLCALGVNLTLSVMKSTIFLWFNFYFVERTDSERQISPSIDWSKGIQRVKGNGNFNVTDV